MGRYYKTGLMHIGYNNPNYDYFMGDVRIESIDIEKDLGVHIHKSLKVKEQLNYVVKKANRILGTIRRTYTDKSMKNIKNIYTSSWSDPSSKTANRHGAHTFRKI